MTFMSDRTGTGESNRRANRRFLAMARVMLKIVLLSWVVLLSIVMSACVIPVAPEFEDPVVKNYAPGLDSVSPPFWSVTDVNTVFRVQISDPNLSDTLYLRMFADYPPWSEATREISPPQAQFGPVTPPSTNPSRSEITFAIDCYGLVAMPQHRIVVLLADRPFVRVSGQLRPEGDGLMAEGGWLYDELNCPRDRAP